MSTLFRCVGIGMAGLADGEMGAWGGQVSASPHSPHSVIHPTAKPHHLLQSAQQQQQGGGIVPSSEHVVRPLPSLYRPALPPNPFRKDDSSAGSGAKEKHSPDSSLSSGPPQSVTTVSFSTMSAGKSADQQQPSSSLPPRPQATNSRKKCSGKSDENGATCATLGRCHCSKRRYHPCSSSHPIPLLRPCASLSFAHAHLSPFWIKQEDGF